MAKHQSKLIIIFCLLVSAVVVYFGLYPKLQISNTMPSPVPTPTSKPPVPVAKASQSESVVSSDGGMTLDTMKLTNDKGSTAYTFLVTSKAGGVQKGIFSKTEPAGTTLSVPANTFSPDDKYIFLKESSSSATGYFVLTSSGLPITKDVQTLDFSGLFAAKYSNYVITEATGWAAPTLIVINTNKTDDSLGPSFWFNVTSKSFIPLSERFN
jgi:hypothetical protein